MIQQHINELEKLIAQLKKEKTSKGKSETYGIIKGYLFGLYKADYLTNEEYEIHLSRISTFYMAII